MAEIRAKKGKFQRLAFWGLNVKLRSGERKGKEAYLDLFRELYHRRLKIKMPQGKHAVLRSQFTAKVGGDLVVHGKVCRFIVPEGARWLNYERMELEEPQIPKHFFPGGREVDYYFIPSAHRILIRKTTGFSINSLKHYFQEAFKVVAGAGEEVEVLIEQAQDAFDQIRNAVAIRRVDIEISYSNDDFNKPATAHMDKQVRAMRAAKLKIQATPDHHQSLSLDSELLQGALGLAQSNGIVEARIIDADNKKKTINTEFHPRLFSMFLRPAEDLVQKLHPYVMGIFRKPVG